VCVCVCVCVSFDRRCAVLVYRQQTLGVARAPAADSGELVLLGKIKKLPGNFYSCITIQRGWLKPAFRVKITNWSKTSNC